MLTAQIARIARQLAAAGIEGARGEAWLLLAAATGQPRGALMAGALDRLTPVGLQAVLRSAR